MGNVTCWITKMQDMGTNGQCCNCGYHGKRETPCLKRPDAIHCEHWWDGPDEGQGKEAGG